jgi:putative alpha-1,2-mannosidase
LLITGALAGCGGDSPGSQAGAAAVASDPLRDAPQSSANANSDGSGADTTNDNAQTSTASNATRRLTQYVNPLIGTLASDSPNPVPAGQAGSVVPAAGLPNGMVQWAPDTNTTPGSVEQRGAGLAGRLLLRHRLDSEFQSRPHERRAGCSSNDGEFPVMPTLDATKPLAQPFDHANEKAVAGAYSVLLDNQIKVELTATLRTGFGRFTYPAQQESTLVLDMTYTNTQSGVAGTVTQVEARTISDTTTGGHFCGNSTNVPVYFYAQFSQPFTNTPSFTRGRTVINFGKAGTALMKIGISYVSVANAKDHVQKENPSWDFDDVKTVADAVWNQRLNAIQVSSQDKTALTKFYTAFYHALWAPSVFSDDNGQYIGFDQQVHAISAGHAA